MLLLYSCVDWNIYHKVNMYNNHSTCKSCRLLYTLSYSYPFTVEMKRNACFCSLESAAFHLKLMNASKDSCDKEVNFVELSFVVADNSVLFCLVIIVRISRDSYIVPGSA